MVLDALTASLIGGIICLDRIFIQAMFSRPIVAGACIGLILGEPYTGLMTGALVELFWIDQSQIGTYIPPNDSIAAIVITASTILSGKVLGAFPIELIAVSILLLIPIGILGRELDVMIIRANDGLSRSALEDAIRGDAFSIEKKTDLWAGQVFFHYGHMYPFAYARSDGDHPLVVSVDSGKIFCFPEIHLCFYPPSWNCRRAQYNQSKGYDSGILRNFSFRYRFA